MTAPSDPSGTNRLGRDAIILVAKIPVIIFSVEAVVMLILEAVTFRMTPVIEALVEASLLTIGASPAIAWLVVRPLLQAVAAEARVTEDREMTLRSETARQELEGRLGRAVSMAERESDLIETVGIALEHIIPADSAELLLADAQSGELRRAVGSVGCLGCSVEAPQRCAAARRGQTLAFTSSDALDACSYLRARGSGVAATCVPVSVVGKVIGVLHASSESSPLSPQRTLELEALASHFGNRLGLLRVVAAMEKQAGTDPLTGLANRRAFELRAGELLRSRKPFALAVCDLDHFKRLNDTFGHEAGDRALKRFSRVLSEALREGDIAVRFGGEEFVLIFADGDDMTQVVPRLDGVRAALAAVAAGGTLPPFTVSIGVTTSRGYEDLETLTAVADRALYHAKHSGRDRVVVAGTNDVAANAPATEPAEADRAVS